MTIPLAALLAALLLLPVGRADAQDLGPLFLKVAPSVVVIRAQGRDVSSPVSGLTYFSEVGSGVLVSNDGKVMTAAHVVHAMDEISVEFLGGQPVKAHVIASEPAADLSLLQLDRVPPNAVPARLGNSDAARVGAQVIVVGAPYGLGHSLSVGWISAKYGPNTVYRAMPLAEFLQTTAAINQGNSGGPMFNMAGEVIGIVSHNISKSGGSEGLGFTVTVNTARQLLLERRSVWSGLDGTLLTGELAEVFNVPQPAGYLIKTVAKGSPEWEMGLRGGDRVATIGGQQIVVRGDVLLTIEGLAVGEGESYEKIRQRLIAMRPGQPIKVTVLRAGQILELVGRAP
jgi:serine protease Do